MKVLLLASAIIVVFAQSCKTTRSKNNSIHRLTYHVSDKKIVDAQSNEVGRPLEYQSGNDIQVNLENFNPLRDQIIVNDSSLTRFNGDGEKFSSYIILPKVPQLSEAKDKASTTQNLLEESFFEKLLRVEKSLATKRVTDCDLIKTLMVDYNLAVMDYESVIDLYKRFWSKMDLIKDDHDFLKGLREIKNNSTVIAERLQSSFLNSLNHFLVSAGKDALSEDILFVRESELNNLEEDLYQEIKDATKNIKNINAEIEKLTGKDCDDFTALYKKFKSSFDEFSKHNKNFEEDYNSRIQPAFIKNVNLLRSMLIYNNATISISTSAIPIENDKHTIIIKTKPVDGSTISVHDYINIVPKKGLKVDFSGGFFFGGLNDVLYTKKSLDSIYTKTYLLDGQKRDTTVKETFTAIYEKDQANITFGGMVYLHAHTHNPGKMLNYGMHLGFGALFNDQARWAGSVGATLLIGKKQRFNINPGILIAQVERLAKPYETGTFYNETIDNIPTYKPWKVSWIVGFSWNF